MATAIRPFVPVGSPVLTGRQVSPPSVDLKRPLAGPRPEGLGVLGVGGQGADRLHLLVEDRLIGEAAVDRLPDAAARRPDVDGQRAVGHRLDRRDPAAGLRRPQGPRRQAAEGALVDLDLGLCRGDTDTQSRCQEAGEPLRCRVHGFPYWGLGAPSFFSTLGMAKRTSSTPGFTSSFWMVMTWPEGAP